MMHSPSLFLLLASLTSPLLAVPIQQNNNDNNNISPLSDPSYGPIPGESSLYSDYRGKSPPFPANMTAPVPASTSGTPAADDLLFQNLLSAEWIVFSFYQQGVEAFNASSFTAAGYPNTTYDRIAEIRDNEAGHLRLFQDAISSNSAKPGACRYSYGFDSPRGFLTIQLLIEASSMAYLTGLVQDAQTSGTRGALVGIAEVETRHEAWALIDIWNTNPFSGPSDTVYPYPTHLLAISAPFVIPGSCPSQNLPYPYPAPNLSTLGFNANTSTALPGAPITFTFPATAPAFVPGKDYFAVFFHGAHNVSVSFDPRTLESRVPSFETGKGLVLVVIADAEGASSLTSVVAGPLILLMQPTGLTAIDAGS